MNSLNIELCWLYSFFLYLLFPNFILEFPENMIEPPTLWQGSYKISLVHLSISLPVRLSGMHFPQDLRIECLKFFVWWYFAMYTKKWQSDNLENCVCCLDNWVNNTSLDPKWNVWHFNEGNIKNRLLKVVGQNALHKSDCSIF